MIDVKPFVELLDKKTVAVFGLGRSGLSTVKALLKAKAKVIAWDDREESRSQAEKLGAQLAPLDLEQLSACDVLVLSPGVPLTNPEPHPVVKAAREAGVDIIGDIEIFAKSIDQSYITIGLTGTNGKSTTTTLMHHIFTACGVDAALGGNIGLPVLDMNLPPKGAVIVLELSSYQLDLCKDFAPDIGVILNVTPDHLDRHGTMDSYAATKEKIFAKTGGTAVIAVDDAYTKQIAEQRKTRGDGTVILASITDTQSGGVYVQAGTLIDDIEHTAEEVGSVSNITKLHGLHNMQNAAAAYAAARHYGLEPQAILNAMQSYPGLPHRQFPVRIMNGVAYINDSKATNAEATSKALACHKAIYWVLGGISKDGGLKGLEGFMERVRYAFLIGSAADEFAMWLDKYGVEYRVSKTLDVAVSSAHRMAQEERGKPGGAGVVLFSPACASFDQYESFEQRGDAFADLVESLEDGEAA